MILINYFIVYTGFLPEYIRVKENWIDYPDLLQYKNLKSVIFCIMHQWTFLGLKYSYSAPSSSHLK